MQTLKAVLKTMSLYLQTVGRLFFFLLFVEEHLSSLKESSAVSKIRNPQNICKVQTRTSLVRMVKFICMFTRPFKDKNIDQLKLMAISTSSLLSARPGSDDSHNLLLLAYYSFNLFLSLLSNNISPLRNCLGVFILVSYVHQKVSSQQRKRGK